MTKDTPEHEHAAALLPWLVNGTLEGEERERVERHVRHCLRCRSELAEQMKLQAFVSRRSVVDLSADAGFERLRARLDRAPRRAAPRRLFWAMAATAAIAGVGGTIAAGLLGGRGGPGVDGPDGSAGFRTLSDAAATGAMIDVIFTEGVRESEMRALLEDIDAEIVAGPSRNLGRYTLRIRTAAGATDIDTIVRRLLSDERVRFAGPTFSPPSSLDPNPREDAP